MEAKVLYSPFEHGHYQMVANLDTGEEICFSGTNTTPEYMLLYAHYQDRGDLPNFFQACRDGKVESLIDQFKDQFRVSDSGKTVTLWGWCVLLK